MTGRHEEQASACVPCSTPSSCLHTWVQARRWRRLRPAAGWPPPVALALAAANLLAGWSSSSLRCLPRRLPLLHCPRADTASYTSPRPRPAPPDTPPIVLSFNRKSVQNCGRIVSDWEKKHINARVRLMVRPSAHRLASGGGRSGEWGVGGGCTVAYANANDRASRTEGSVCRRGKAHTKKRRRQKTECRRNGRCLTPLF